MAEPQDFVVVHKASSLSEAELVRGILEEAGILAVIPDRNVPLPGLDITPFDGEYFGSGCAVFVPQRDLEKAKQTIAEARASSQLAGEQTEAGGNGDSAGPDLARADDSGEGGADNGGGDGEG